MAVPFLPVAQNTERKHFHLHLAFPGKQQGLVLDVGWLT